MTSTTSSSGRKEKFNAAAIVEECFKAINYYSEKKEKVKIRLKNGDKLILETTEKHFENADKRS